MYIDGFFRIQCTLLVIFQIWPLNSTRFRPLYSLTFCLNNHPSMTSPSSGLRWVWLNWPTSMFLTAFFYIYFYIIFVLGIRELPLISNDDLFLCESGDEIISLGHRCNIRPNCGDQSDERNCNRCKLFWSKLCKR